MSEVIDRSLERVRRRRNDIHFDVEVIGWQVYGDAAGLSRAALNLMDNAAKWSPSGGHVGVKMRQLDPSHAELVVSDHGPGIPPHERRLVFERFYRSTTARALPGFGPGAGDRQTGSAQPRWIASRRRHRGWRSAPWHVDLCAATRPPDAQVGVPDGWGRRQQRSQDRPRGTCGRERGKLSGFSECYLSGLSVRAGTVG